MKTILVLFVLLALVNGSPNEISPSLNVLRTVANDFEQARQHASSGSQSRRSWFPPPPSSRGHLSLKEFSSRPPIQRQLHLKVAEATEEFNAAATKLKELESRIASLDTRIKVLMVSVEILEAGEKFTMDHLEFLKEPVKRLEDWLQKIESKVRRLPNIETGIKAQLAIFMDILDKGNVRSSQSRSEIDAEDKLAVEKFHKELGNAQDQQTKAQELLETARQELKATQENLEDDQTTLDRRQQLTERKREILELDKKLQKSEQETRIAKQEFHSKWIKWIEAKKALHEAVYDPQTVDAAGQT